MTQKIRVPDYSPLGEYRLRVKDAKERLAKSFCCFFDAGKVKLFIGGGEYEAAFFTSSNFAAFIVGGSLSEVEEGTRLIKGVASKIATLYSERDFHASVAKYFLSQYLKAHLENKDTIVGLAVEYMLFDITQRLTMINLNGDTQVLTEGDTKGKIFFVGCYDPALKQRITRAVSKELTKQVPKNPKEAHKLADRLKKSLKIKYIGMQIMRMDTSQGTPEVTKEDGDTEED